MTVFFSQYDHLQNQPRSLITVTETELNYCEVAGLWAAKNSDVDDFLGIFLKFSEQFLCGTPIRECLGIFFS